MSLFVGKNNQGISVLHISKTEASLEYMKNYPQYVNTAFHSELNYLTAKRFTGFSIIRGYTETSGGWTHKFDAVYLTDEFLNFIAANGSPGFIMFIDGALFVSYAAAAWGGQFIAFAPGSYLTDPAAYPSYAKRYLGLPNTVYSGSVELFTLNVGYNGFIPTAKTNNEISIKRSSIKVRGVELNKFDYVSTQPMNAYDKSMRFWYYTYNYSTYPATQTEVTSNYLQIVQSSLISGSMELDKNSIKIGGHTIFSSSASAGNLQYKDMSTKYYSQVNSGVSSLLSDFVFNENELFIIVNLFYDYGPYAVPFKFRNGSIAYINTFINWNAFSWTDASLVGINNQLYLVWSSNEGTVPVPINARILRFTG